MLLSAGELSFLSCRGAVRFVALIFDLLSEKACGEHNLVQPGDSKRFANVFDAQTPHLRQTCSSAVIHAIRYGRLRDCIRSTERG